MSASLGPCSGLRPGIQVGRALRRERMRVAHCHRKRFGRRVGPRLLVRRPRSLDGLAGHLEVVNDLRPRPNRRALAGFGGVLNQFVQAWITSTVTRRLDCQVNLQVLSADREPRCSAESQLANACWRRAVDWNSRCPARRQTTPGGVVRGLRTRQKVEERSGIHHDTRTKSPEQLTP
jgi:hypothetical protein